MCRKGGAGVSFCDTCDYQLHESKRQPVSPDLHMSSLSPAPLDELVSYWSERLERETRPPSVSDVYGGRSFQEARATAAKLGAKLVVVSAGLGLIEASTPIPSLWLYGYGRRGRWRAVARAGCVFDRVLVAGCFQSIPFSPSLEDLVRDHPGPLLIALSQTYLDMLAPDLMALPAEHQCGSEFSPGRPSTGRPRLCAWSNAL